MKKLAADILAATAVLAVWLCIIVSGIDIAIK